MAGYSNRDKALSVSALARSYASSSKILLNEGTSEQMGPAVYLLSHSLELSVKSYLVFCGVSESVLASKKYGHNIISCLKLSKEHALFEDLRMSWKEVKQIAMINKYYMGKKFEYFFFEPKSLGSVINFEVIVYKITSKVDEIILSSVFNYYKKT